MSKENKPNNSNMLFFTSTGFGIKSVSKDTVKKNLDVLRDIAKDAQKSIDKKTKEQAEPAG